MPRTSSQQVLGKHPNKGIAQSLLLVRIIHHVYTVEVGLAVGPFEVVTRTTDTGPRTEMYNSESMQVIHNSHIVSLRHF